MSLFYRLKKIKEATLFTFRRPRRMLLLLLGLFLMAALPVAYRESWLDPFTTLNVPNRLLKPHAVTLIAYVPNDNPTKTMIIQDPSRVRKFMSDLSMATLLKGEEPPNTTTALHFIFHREASGFHKAEDFALEFDPEKGIVYFAGQAFRLPEAGQLYFTKLPTMMQPGWIN